MRAQKFTILSGVLLSALALTVEPARAVIDVSSLDTSNHVGTPGYQAHVQGAGLTVFRTNQYYNIHWSGAIQQVDSIEAGGETFLPSVVADDIRVRRFPTANPRQNNAINWFTGVGDATATDLYLEGERPTDYESTFSSNNLLIGIDNLFVNTPEGNNNYSNVERLDYLFTGGFVVTESLAFTIFERGDASIHDGFRIAAVTQTDGANDPSNYGQVLTLAMGDWGQTDLIAPTNHLVLRDNLNTAEIDYRPSQFIVQSIGAVMIRATDLAPLGSTIFGYSLFGPDTTGVGTQLVDFLNPSFFPRNTNGINGHALGGGLDLIGASSVLYTNVSDPPGVPEPTVLAPLLGAASLLRRRR